ncbi:MAG TPA: hypothetical protein VHW23_43460, partial [Kofleriaceae bacterium]|nr:hypothetical protein [Kofleriaceae bacterium]
IRELEQFRQVMAAIAYPTAPRSGRALAVVMRNDRELSEVNNLGEPRAMTHAPAAPLWQPLVLLSLSGAEQRTLAHELTHLVSLAVIHRQSRWLAEGMAAYFESAQLNADGTMVTVGLAPARYGSLVHLAPVARLFRWGEVGSTGEERALYQTAWALVAYLINEHKAELGHYLWLVEHGGDPANGGWRELQQRAWDAAFPSLPLDALGDKLTQWLRYGSHRVLWFYLRPAHAPITARRLSDADAYAVRSFLFDGPTPEQRSRGRAERSQALALEPTNVLAWVLRVVDGERPTADVGRAIAAAHPDDWRAWWLATMALEDAGAEPAELDRARGQACALIARNGALVAPPRLCPDRLHASAP